ncbi:dephospho-CoA kinase [Anaplasma centrale str. Israel]|uniref:Dephospho-CoA kinase n=2 Tax=Anaplasma centrale TaxID=769 RepID=D1ASD6_ANACI|nr:dephospho-CoA kinase [Anaplasma centrale str. Israel]
MRLLWYIGTVMYGAHMIVFGLSGGAGSGKSTVAAMFAQSCNAAVFDADKIVHSMYSGDATITGLVAKYFPDCICNGVVSRERLSKHFFSYGPLWLEFQSIVHSIVLRQQRKFILEQSKIGRDYAVLDVPLLLEAGFWRCCDFVINVDVHKSLQWHRLRQRGLSEREIEFLLSLQMPRGSRRNFADFYVNCGERKGEVLKSVLQIVGSLNAGRHRFQVARKKLAMRSTLDRHASTMASA